MPKPNLPTEIQINKYITEEKAQILSLIDKHHRVLLQANPASGKTYFFKELTKDIKSGKRKGRLVFVAPFLIITDQFKNDLLAKGIKVDLELRGTSLRKKLNDTDKIITSTFQSLHHIVDNLKEDDIIVVDEAHALFYNYHKGANSRQYYTITIQNLYHTKSKLVLMSGTPNLSLIQILTLHHIIVTKRIEIEASINIEYTNLTHMQVVKEFVFKTITDNGKDKLNIIYIKNVNECIKISELLNEMGYNSEVITSLHKGEETYNSIAELQTIPNDVQFLVSTNVISTGTNIKNTNVGSALMLNEYSPQEIKQFSKRFRGKLNIQVDVVNKGFLSEIAKHSISEIQNQRNYLNNTLIQFETAKSNQNFNFDFEKSHDKSDLATPNAFIDSTLERYLIQESTYIDDAENSYTSPNDIVKELNKYSDINANVVYDYDDIKKLKFQLGINMNNSDTDNKFKARIEALIDDFDNNTEAYLTALTRDKNMDYTIKNSVKRLIYGELTKPVPYSKHVIDTIKSPLFNKNILTPILEFREYFNSTKDFIKFLKSDKNKNYCITSLVINKLFYDYFYIDKTPTEYEPTSSSAYYSLKHNNNIPLKHLSPDLIIILKIIELTFQFCFDQESVVINELKDFLENDKALNKLIINSNDLLLFPLNTITIDKNYFSLNNIIVKAIIQGVFYTKQKYVKTTRKGVQKRALKLNSKLPKGFNNIELDVSTRVHKINYRIITSVLTTTSKEPMQIKETSNFNYINSYDLIIKEQL